MPEYIFKEHITGSVTADTPEQAREVWQEHGPDGGTAGIVTVLEDDITGPYVKSGSTLILAANADGSPDLQDTPRAPEGGSISDAGGDDREVFGDSAVTQ